MALIALTATAAASGCGNAHQANPSSPGGPPAESKPALFWDGKARTWDNSDWT
jgi:hypothetical protein